MDKKQLAEILNNCEYGKEGTPELWKRAKENGLVAVLGYSDNTTILKGAIDADTGLTVFLDETGIIENDCSDMECPYFLERIKKARVIKRKLNKYLTDIPYETFNILEYGELYCGGLVFDKEDLKY